MGPRLWRDRLAHSLARSLAASLRILRVLGDCTSRGDRDHVITTRSTVIFCSDLVVNSSKSAPPETCGARRWVEGGFCFVSRAHGLLLMSGLGVE